MKRRTCPTGKIRYRDRIGASVALIDAQSKAHSQARVKHETRAYRCDRCRGWHLTSQPRRMPA